MQRMKLFVKPPGPGPAAGFNKEHRCEAVRGLMPALVRLDKELTASSAPLAAASSVAFCCCVEGLSNFPVNFNCWRIREATCQDGCCAFAATMACLLGCCLKDACIQWA